MKKIYQITLTIYILTILYIGFTHFQYTLFISVILLAPLLFVKNKLYQTEYLIYVYLTPVSYTHLDIFFVLRSTHKEISSNLVLSNDYNSPQNYFYRQSIQGRKNILLKRLKQAHRHLDQDEIDIAGKILYLISQEYFQRWDSLYDDDLPVEEIKKLIELSNDMIEFFVQRGNDSHFRKL